VARDGSKHKIQWRLNLLNAKNPDGTYVIPSPQTSSSGVNHTRWFLVATTKTSSIQTPTSNLRTSDRLSANSFSQTRAKMFLSSAPVYLAFQCSVP